jgi:hypothetical protein
MEYWDFLMYKRTASCAGRANIKKRHGPFFRDRAAGISHRRGSWLACRREMLLNHQMFSPLLLCGGASEVLVHWVDLLCVIMFMRVIGPIKWRPGLFHPF